MVNRNWQHNFGEGLFARQITLENWARPGSADASGVFSIIWPGSFMKNNWSIKSMHRLIMFVGDVSAIVAR